MWTLRKLTAGMMVAAVATVGGVQVPGASAEEQICPSVAVVVARGSDQNEEFEPTSYSPESPWTSNGYEERNVRAFLHFAEARHREQTGESLMKDVQVLGLDDTTYPAEFPFPVLTEPDEDVELPEMTRRVVGTLRETPAHLIARNAATGFVGSLRAGVDNTVGFIDDWEAETGCTPGYILIGYSQGALVLSAQEQALAERGQLIGSLYLGNPLLATGDAAVVGDPRRGGGLMSSVPSAVVVDSQHLNYCVTDDFVCDVTPSAVKDALNGKGGVHARYFLDIEENGHSDADAEVADIFAEWVTGYSPHP